MTTTKYVLAQDEQEAIHQLGFDTLAGAQGWARRNPEAIKEMSWGIYKVEIASHLVDNFTDTNEHLSVICSSDEGAKP